MTRDDEAERAVIATALLSNITIRPMLATGLRAEHFGNPAIRGAFEAVVEIADDKGTVDPYTVGQRVGVSAAQVAALYPMESVSPTAARQYAERVKVVAGWRRRDQAGRLLIQAAEVEDTDRAAEADALLTTPDEQQSRTFTPEELQDRIYARLEGKVKVETFPLPFGKLNDATAGGLRRGEVLLLGGWTSHGKSVLLDQLLSNAAKHCKVHLYINEMTVDERVERIVARNGELPFSVLRRGDLNEEQQAQAKDGINGITFGITDAAGWSAQDIARHIGWYGWDVVGIDILHLIDHREERDVAEISRVLNRAAKPAAGNCAIVATVHLNENRIREAERPRPALGDIRGSGMLKNDADAVLFVHRQQNEDGVPGPEGFVYFAKNRNGELAGMAVRFRPERMRFEGRAA